MIIIYVLLTLVMIVLELLFAKMKFLIALNQLHVFHLCVTQRTVPVTLNQLSVTITTYVPLIPVTTLPVFVNMN